MRSFGSVRCESSKVVRSRFLYRWLSSVQVPLFPGEESKLPLPQLIPVHRNRLYPKCTAPVGLRPNLLTVRSGHHFRQSFYLQSGCGLTVNSENLKDQLIQTVRMIQAPHLSHAYISLIYLSAHAAEAIPDRVRGQDQRAKDHSVSRQQDVRSPTLRSRRKSTWLSI